MMWRNLKHSAEKEATGYKINKIKLDHTDDNSIATGLIFSTIVGFPFTGQEIILSQIIPSAWSLTI